MKKPTPRQRLLEAAIGYGVANRRLGEAIGDDETMSADVLVWDTWRAFKRALDAYTRSIRTQEKGR